MGCLIVIKMYLNARLQFILFIVGLTLTTVGDVLNQKLFYYLGIIFAVQSACINRGFKCILEYCGRRQNRMFIVSFSGLILFFIPKWYPVIVHWRTYSELMCLIYGL